MKRIMLVLGIVLFYAPLNFAEESSGKYEGKEIGNLVSAVKAANPGDYILLPSGEKYILTEKEIAGAKGEFDQETSGGYGGKEIENLVSAVKVANPGDYILLPSGKKYILTKEEIAGAKGEFDYEDLSEVPTKIEEDGTEIKTISQSHIAYVYPDGQATHILKTNISFRAFMRYIQETFFLVQYIDLMESTHEYINIDPPNFSVFRASVQYQTISDGVEELEALDVIAYNYDGEHIRMRYCAKPDMVWGNISNEGAYKPVGESRKIEFDVE